MKRKPQNKYWTEKKQKFTETRIGIFAQAVVAGGLFWAAMVLAGAFEGGS